MRNGRELGEGPPQLVKPEADMLLHLPSFGNKSAKDTKSTAFETQNVNSKLEYSVKASDITLGLPATSQPAVSGLVWHNFKIGSIKPHVNNTFCAETPDRTGLYVGGLKDSLFEGYGELDWPNQNLK